LVDEVVPRIHPELLGGLPPTEAFAPVDARFALIAKNIIGATILWVDDKHPNQNLCERRTMSAYGLRIDMVRTTAEAIQLLSMADYDVVITNMDRSKINDEKAPCFESAEPSGAGCYLAREIAKLTKPVPTIIYVSKFDPSYGTPAFVFGITNRADYLIQFVFDAIEREPR
jgi:hypothetical protein